MPVVNFRTLAGTVESVNAPEGTSVMKAAVAHGIPGIIAECGGQAMCATCHVYVLDSPPLPDLTEDEDEMLDCTSAPRTATSRLSCQLEVSDELDGLEVEVPRDP